MKFFQRIKHLLLLRRHKTFNYTYLSGGHYDKGFFIRKFYHRKRFHFINKKLRILNPKGTIVDVGSGSGNILEFFNKKKHN